jgi:hypothetical protein
MFKLLGEDRRSTYTLQHPSNVQIEEPAHEVHVFSGALERHLHLLELPLDLHLLLEGAEELLLIQDGCENSYP